MGVIVLLPFVVGACALEEARDDADVPQGKLVHSDCKDAIGSTAGLSPFRFVVVVDCEDVVDVEAGDEEESFFGDDFAVAFVGTASLASLSTVSDAMLKIRSDYKAKDVKASLLRQL